MSNAVTSMIANCPRSVVIGHAFPSRATSEFHDLIEASGTARRYVGQATMILRARVERRMPSTLGAARRGLDLHQNPPRIAAARFKVRGAECSSSAVGEESVVNTIGGIVRTILEPLQG
jgi:hypothetical protein